MVFYEKDIARQIYTRSARCSFPLTQSVQKHEKKQFAMGEREPGADAGSAPPAEEAPANEEAPAEEE